MQKCHSPSSGLASVLAACFLSGFAGVYVEKLLKQSRSTSVWLQNVQLSALAIPISIGFVAAQDGRKVMDAGLGQGFDSVVWAVVLLQCKHWGK
jgi:solute carrier family 35 (UDP-sugar transporter), member A1/2/3